MSISVKLLTPTVKTPPRRAGPIGRDGRLAGGGRVPGVLCADLWAVCGVEQVERPVSGCGMISLVS